MEATAKARFVRVTPMKARRVVDLVRGREPTAGPGSAGFDDDPDRAGGGRDRGRYDEKEPVAS